MNQCPTCGEEYQRLGQHFAFNSDHRPPLSELQRNVVEYLVLRGVQVRDNGSESRLEVYSTDENFIRSVADALGWLSNEPRVHKSGERAAERLNEQYGSDSLHFNPEDYNDMWGVSTVPHPELDNYSQGPEAVTELSWNTLRWVVLSAGTWEGIGPFGSLHVDVRGMSVEGDHFHELLHEIDVATVEGSKVDDTSTERYHWDGDVIAIEHYEAMGLLDTLNIDLESIMPKAASSV